MKCIVARPVTGSGRWSSFIAIPASASSGKVRGLCEEGNERHGVRVEYDKHKLLIHVSDEHGGGWTTIAIDRATREWSVAQRDRQLDAAARCGLKRVAGALRGLSSAD